MNELLMCLWMVRRVFVVSHRPNQTFAERAIFWLIHSRRGKLPEAKTRLHWVFKLAFVNRFVGSYRVDWDFENSKRSPAWSLTGDLELFSIVIDVL